MNINRKFLEKIFHALVKLDPSKFKASILYIHMKKLATTGKVLVLDTGALLASKAASR